MHKMKNSENLFPFRYESTGLLKTSMTEAFEYLDDSKRLTSHMGKSSWMMAGSHMEIELDKKRGQDVGSEIILKSKMLGMQLFVKEVIIERSGSPYDGVEPENVVSLRRISPQASDRNLLIACSGNVGISSLDHRLPELIQVHKKIELFEYDKQAISNSYAQLYNKGGST